LGSARERAIQTEKGRFKKIGLIYVVGIQNDKKHTPQQQRQFIFSKNKR
jgi:hypothetical protein